MSAKKDWSILIAALSLLLYGYLFYFIDRYQSWPLAITYTLLFGGYLFLVNMSGEVKINQLLALALLFRLVPLFAIPALSDDVYRFIWDGRLWSAGINPFAGIPDAFVNIPNLATKGLTRELYELLNSPTHYTIYPPIPQYINLLAAKLFPDNILYSIYLIRVCTISAEMISIMLMYLILQQKRLKPQLIAIYAFNPLVIIELSGNLHHEALMITFLLAFIYLMLVNKNNLAAIMLALSVASKLLPLMFLPFILLKQRHWLRFSAVFGITLLILFGPLLDASFFRGMMDSLTLYYQKFEFNAGIYYLLREVGLWIYGYNAIALIGKLLLAIATILILGLSLKLWQYKVGYAISFTVLYLVFAVLSLILHPWYILLLIAMAPFTGFKFPTVWSFFIIFTYLGYSQTGFTENYYVVATEFMALLIAIIYDARSSSNLKVAP